MVTIACRGHGDAEPGQPGPHHRLVLRVHERLGSRPYGDAEVLEGVQVLGRHVLVVEGDDGAPRRDLTQGLQVAVVADDVVGDDLGGRDSRGLREQPKGQPEGDCRLSHHPRQLPAPDHGERGGEVVGHAGQASAVTGDVS